MFCQYYNYKAITYFVESNVNERLLKRERQEGENNSRPTIFMLEISFEVQKNIN